MSAPTKTRENKRIDTYPSDIEKIKYIPYYLLTSSKINLLDYDFVPNL